MIENDIGKSETRLFMHDISSWMLSVNLRVCTASSSYLWVHSFPRNGTEQKIIG